MLDFARVDVGTTVVGASEGVADSPHNVEAALGGDLHLIFTSRPTEASPNMFELDLGQIRSLQSVDIDWLHAVWDDDEKPCFKIDVRLNESDRWHTFMPGDDPDAQGTLWAGRVACFHVRPEPIEARYVRFTAVAQPGDAPHGLKIQRFSLYESSRIPRLVRDSQQLARLILREFEQISALPAVSPELSAQTTKAKVYFRAWLEHLATASPISHDQWQEFFDRIAVEQEQLRSLHASQWWRWVDNEANGAPYLATVAHAEQAVMPDRYLPPLKDQIDLDGARGERVDYQVVLIPAASRPLRITLEPSDLSSETGRIPAQAIEVNAVYYVKTDSLSPTVELNEVAGLPRVGWWPDILVPGSHVDLRDQVLQSMWLTIRIPGDIPAGGYDGQVLIRDENDEHITSVEIKLRVWDFTLPHPGHLKTIFSLSRLITDVFWHGSMSKQERAALLEAHIVGDNVTIANSVSETQWHEYYRFLAERRLNPTSLYSKMIPTRDELEMALSLGMNAFVVGYACRRIDDERYFERLLNELDHWLPLLEEKGVLEKAYIYLVDEPPSDQNTTDMIQARAAVLNERYPQLKRMATLTRPVDLAYEHAVNAWVTAVPYAVDLELEAGRRAVGDEVWWYTVEWGLNLDSPRLAPRIWSWLAWNHDIAGILYWIIQAGWLHEQNTANWWNDIDPPFTHWRAERDLRFNGIGTLVYPGKDQSLLSSIRLEMLQAGLQDYEYLHHLNHLLNLARVNSAADAAVVEQAETLLNKVNTVTADFNRYSDDPQVLRSYRRTIAEMIERINGDLSSGNIKLKEV